MNKSSQPDPNIRQRDHTQSDYLGGAGGSTLTQTVAAALSEEILSGRLEPGSWIRPLELARRFGTSATPVREALRSLAAEGVVTALPQRGYQVSPASHADLEDTYRIRMVLDPLAVELAVPRLTAEDIKASEEALESLISTYDRDDAEAHRFAHRLFHFSIYQSCGSPWLLRLLRLLWDNSERYQRLSLAERGSPTDRAREHRGIFEAARAGNVDEAVALTRAHLALTTSSVNQLLAHSTQGSESARW